MSSHGESVSIADWISTRTPPAPDALKNLLRSLVGNACCAPHDLPSTLVSISTRMFDDLGNSRESALHLLAADALITYAMEAGAELGVETAAESAMKTLGSVMSR